MAEREHASGKDFLAAFVLGSDLCSRLGGSITGQHKGWFTTSIYGVFGAGAAAAKILSARRAADPGMRSALRLSQAARHAAGQRRAGLTKRLQSAFATRAGVFSALLGRARYHRAARRFRRQIRVCTSCIRRAIRRKFWTSSVPLRSREYDAEEVPVLRVQPCALDTVLDLIQRVRLEPGRRARPSRSRIHR
jgi:hypothetical protein